MVGTVAGPSDYGCIDSAFGVDDDHPSARSLSTVRWGFSKESPMPARLAQQDDENGLMEAACPQAVSASLANPNGVRAPRLHPRYFQGSHS
jgi:hypothetical protein